MELHYSWHPYVAGYGNTTSAINAVQFNMSSGNIDDWYNTNVWNFIGINIY
jgi:hypothetical protein